MTDALTVANAALERLKKSSEKSSLDEVVAAKTKRSLLIVDCSGSMSDRIATGERKIDKLRKVVDELRTTHPVPVAAFGLYGTAVQLVERIPDPSGMTPLDRAITFGRVQEANHLVVVTDGLPDNEQRALDAATAFGGPIDVFYIGDGNDTGAAFCARLAKLTGGQCGVTDLTGETKKLAAGIAGLLGSGEAI